MIRRPWRDAKVPEPEPRGAVAAWFCREFTAANIIQLAAIGLAAYSLCKYFLPEQLIKLTEQKLAVAQAELIEAELARDIARADKVRLKHALRGGIVSTLPAYLSVRCRIEGPDSPRKLTECVTRAVTTGEFAPLLFQRDMSALIAAVPEYAAQAEATWKQELDAIHRRVEEAKAACAQRAPAEQGDCATQAENLRLRLGDGLFARRDQVVRDVFKGWASTKLGQPCPTLGQLGPLPKEWPADCD